MGNKKRPMPPSSPASPQQEAYLHGLRVHHRRVIYARLGLLVGFFALWELAAFLGWIDPFIASSPSRMMRTLYDLVAQGQLWHHLYTTPVSYTHLGTGAGHGHRAGAQVHRAGRGRGRYGEYLCRDGRGHALADAMSAGYPAAVNPWMGR